MEEAEESKHSPIIKRIDVSPSVSPSPCLDFLKLRVFLNYYSDFIPQNVFWYIKKHLKARFGQP